MLILAAQVASGADGPIMSPDFARGMRTLPPSWQRPPPTPGQDIPHQGRGRSAHSQVRPAARDKFFLESSLPPRKRRTSRSPTLVPAKPNLHGHVPWWPLFSPHEVWFSDSLSCTFSGGNSAVTSHPHFRSYTPTPSAPTASTPSPLLAPNQREERSCNGEGDPARCFHWASALASDPRSGLQCLMPPTCAQWDLGLKDVKARFSTYHDAWTWANSWEHALDVDYRCDSKVFQGDADLPNPPLWTGPCELACTFWLHITTSTQLEKPWEPSGCSQSCSHNALSLTFPSAEMASSGSHHRCVKFLLQISHSIWLNQKQASLSCSHGFLYHQPRARETTASLHTPRCS